MGTWGTGIFEGDLALDIKDSIEAMLEHGQTIEETICEILEEYEDCFEDFDEAIPAALAITTLAVQNEFVPEELKQIFIEVTSNEEYWDNLKEESEEFYTARYDQAQKLRRELKKFD